MPDQSPDVHPGAAFTDFFKALLDSRGLSGAQAARRLGVAQSQVSRWRRGEGGISLENLERIHDEFGADLDYLKQLVGLRSSNPVDALDNLAVERQLWRARYDSLMEKKVPKWAWQAYMDACEALAEAYNQMRPGGLNTPGGQSLNASGRTTDEGEPGSAPGDLSPHYAPSRLSYRNATPSLA